MTDTTLTASSIHFEVLVVVGVLGVFTPTAITVPCIFLLWPANPVTELSLTNPATSIDTASAAVIMIMIFVVV